MKPVEFKEQNTVFGEGQEEYNDLPAYVGPESCKPVVSCWELTEEELEVVKKTGKIYVQQLTFGKIFQPLFLSENIEDCHAAARNLDAMIKKQN